MTTILELRGITKAFPGVLANDHINLTLNEGEIHALLGENGAGKTTLMNILYGLYKPDEGEILVNGQKVDIHSPNNAIVHGIGMVHQHFMLIPPFTITENVILGSEPISIRPFLNYLNAKKSVKEVADKYGFQIDPGQLVESLSVGIEQRVEIVKTLYRGASILILDEPTAVLTPQETDELFAVLRKFKEEGKTIIFISHKLNEVLAISDRITVMRAGKVVGELITAKTKKEEIARLMVGRDVLLCVDKKPAQLGAPVLEIRSLEGLNKKKLPALKKVFLTVHAGEIVGIAGVEGNGQTELIEIITGLRKAIGGDIQLSGRSIINKSAKEIFSAGIAHIPEDRLKRGLITEFTIQENLILGRHQNKKFGGTLFLNRKATQDESNQLVQEFDIRPPNASLLVRQLSGGNQQKVIVARELSRNPICLIAAQPTRGVDIGAIEFIHRRIVDARDGGVAVLLISADLSEIMSLSDRIAVLYEGQIMGIIDSLQTDERQLGLMMTGTKVN